jgi:ankyrin repeat protein
MSSKGRVEWASLEPSEGVSSNLWRNELDDHVFVVQRHVLRSAKHRIVLKLPRQPLVCSVDSKEAALSVEALLVTLYTAEALRVGAYRFSDAHLRRFLLRQLSRLRARDSDDLSSHSHSSALQQQQLHQSALTRRTSIGPRGAALEYRLLRDVQDQRDFLSLVNACRACDVDTVQRLLTERARRVAGLVLRGERDASKLLSNVALINCVSEQGTTLPLIAARAIANESHAGSLDDAVRTIALLVQNRCDVNGCTEIGWTLLHEAASTELSALLAWLIETYAAPLLEQSAPAPLAGLTRLKSVDRRLAVPPLQSLQALEGERVDKLLAADAAAAAELRPPSMYLAPKDANGWNGWTPLHHACSVGNLKSVQLLIDAGAPALALTNKFELPLHFFLKSYAVGATSGPAETALAGGSDSEYVAVLTRVLELTDTTACNMADVGGVTPFMVACASCPVEVVRMLLPFADLTLVKHNGETALHDAVRGGSADVCALLLGNGRIDATRRAIIEGSHGLTALELARETRHSTTRTDQIVLLLQAAETQQHSRSVSVVASRRNSGEFVDLGASSAGVAASSSALDASAAAAAGNDDSGSDFGGSDATDFESDLVATPRRRGSSASASSASSLAPSAALPADMVDDLYRVHTECESVLDNTAAVAAAAAAQSQASFDAIVESTQAATSDEPVPPSNVVLDSIACRLLSATPAVVGRIVLTPYELQFRPRLALRNIFVPYTNVLSVQRREETATLAVEIRRRDGSVSELLFGDLFPHLALPVGASTGRSVGEAVVDVFQQQQQAILLTLGAASPSPAALAQARVGASELCHVLTHLCSAGAAGLTPDTLASVRWPVEQTAFRRLVGASQRVDDAALQLRVRHECRLVAHGRTIDGLLLASRDFLAFAERGEVDDGAFARVIRFGSIRELAVHELKAQSRKKRAAEARTATATGSSGVTYDGSHSLTLAMGAAADRWRLDSLPLLVCEAVRNLRQAHVSDSGAAPVDDALVERVCVADALSSLGVRLVSTLSQAGFRLTALIGVVTPELVDDAHDVVWRLRAHGAHVVTFAHDDDWQPDDASVFDLAAAVGKEATTAAATSAAAAAPAAGVAPLPVLFDDIGHGSPLHATPRDAANLRRALQRATALVFVNAFETLNGGSDPVPLVKRLLQAADGSGRLRRIVKLSPIVPPSVATAASGQLECAKGSSLSLCHAVAEQCVRQFAAAAAGVDVHVLQHTPTMQYVLRRVSQSVASRLELALPLSAQTEVPYVHEADIVACVLQQFDAAALGAQAPEIRLRGAHAFARSELAAALGDVCRLRVAVRPMSEDEWMAHLVGGDRSHRVATVAQAERLGGWVRECNELYKKPVECQLVGAETMRSFLERCAPQRCIPKRRCYFRVDDVRELHSTFVALSDGAASMSLAQFRAHCSVALDCDELSERLFGLFEWVDSGGKVAAAAADAAAAASEPTRDDDARLISFEAWLSVWSVLVLGDTFERLDLAWRLLDRTGAGVCTYNDVLSLAQCSHAALRRVGLGVMEPSWATSFYASMKPLNGMAERGGFVRSVLAGRLDVLNEPADASAHSWRDDISNGMTLLQVLKTRPALPFGGQRSLRSVPVLPGTPLWSLATHVLLGVLRAIGEAESSCVDAEEDGVEVDDGTTAVENEERTLALGRDVRARLGGDAYRCDYQIVDCAPVLFRKLRVAYGAGDGLRATSLSLEPLVHNLVWQGVWSGLSGATTTGRSGSLFWRTGDARFLLKTLKPSEEVLLRRFLPFFVAHFERCAAQAKAHPSTCLPSLLAQICGMYRMTSVRDAPVTLIVMRNVFRKPIESQYDLKGSTVGRSVGSATADMARKDLDFGARRINIGRRRRALVLSQIERDSLLLEQLNLCDYSLLLGARHATPDERKAGGAIDVDALGRLPCGGWLSECGTEVYYFSIIDLLTPYDLIKIGEFAFKSVVHGGTGISVQPPRRYRLRFQKFMASVFV